MHSRLVEMMVVRFPAFHTYPKTPLKERYHFINLIHANHL